MPVNDRHHVSMNVPAVRPSLCSQIAESSSPLFEQTFVFTIITAPKRREKATKHVVSQTEYHESGDNACMRHKFEHLEACSNPSYTKHRHVPKSRIMYISSHRIKKHQPFSSSNPALYNDCTSTLVSATLQTSLLHLQQHIVLLIHLRLRCHTACFIWHDYLA